MMHKALKKSVPIIVLAVVLGAALLYHNRKGLEEDRKFPAVFSVSWEPAFCEKRGESKEECRSLTPSRYDATHFSLHGLWPTSANSEYCNIPDSMVALDREKHWDQLPDLHLDAALKSKLDKVMPGTQSFLQRHEWVKHGSCYKDGSASQYFKDALQLMDELNDSPVRQLFVDNLGKKLEIGVIRSAFDRAFGQNAGMRVHMQCRNDVTPPLIEQITVQLYGSFEDVSLSKLILAAKPTTPGCNGGVVDVVDSQ